MFDLIGRYSNGRVTGSESSKYFECYCNYHNNSYPAQQFDKSSSDELRLGGRQLLEQISTFLGKFQNVNFLTSARIELHIKLQNHIIARQSVDSQLYHFDK